MKRGFSTLLFISLVFCAIAQETNGFIVDLTTLDFKVRKGFKEEWIYQYPSLGDQSWLTVPAKPGNRPIVAKNVGLVQPALPPFRFLKLKPETYTFMTEFDGDLKLTYSGGLGLYLGEIGQNWEVYLNGNLVRSELFLDYSGFLKLERTYRGVLIPIDSRFLKIGKNILAFRIVGDPFDTRTGFFLGNTYAIDNYERLLNWKSEYVDITLIGIYLFFALYHILLYLMHKAKSTYVWFGVSSGIMAFYFLFRTSFIFTFVTNSYIAETIELSTMFMMIPAFLAFFDTTIHGKVSLFTKIYACICLLATLMVPFFQTDTILALYQMGMMPVLVWIIAYELVYPLSIAFAKRTAALRSVSPIQWVQTLLRIIIETDAGKLFIGISVITATSLFDIYASQVGLSFATSKYGFLVMIMGSAAILASQFIRVYREVEELNVNLEKKVDDRTRELKTAMDEQQVLNEELSTSNLKLQHSMDIAAKDMKMAVMVQAGLFPKKPPRTPRWDVAFHFTPASGVSGDFYDFYVDEGSLEGVALGDVSGHGIASGLITVLAKSVLYRHFTNNRDRSLGFVIESSNAELVKEMTEVDNYLTCILMRFSGDTVEYVNGAHTEVFFKKAGNHNATLLKPRDDDNYKGPPLGREGLEAPYRAMKFKVQKGDTIVLYTDCLNEARNSDGEEFGVTGIAESLNIAPDGSASDILDTLMQEFRIFVGGEKLTDDLTAIVLKRL